MRVGACRSAVQHKGALRKLQVARRRPSSREDHPQGRNDHGAEGISDVTPFCTTTGVRNRKFDGGVVVAG